METGGQLATHLGLGEACSPAVAKFSTRSAHLAAKRALDIVFSVTLLTLLSPLMLLAAIAVKLTSPGPVFFSQERAGQGKSRFRMLKFRSMRVAATSAEMEPNGILVKSANHPRMTLVGRIIRKTSIDELPQLFNVLFGEMSLVGPRPLIPDMLTVLTPVEQETRARMRPGLTGLWQLRDRVNSSSAVPMIGHDIEYVENFSVWLDLKILLRTIPAVLSCRGAV